MRRVLWRHRWTLTIGIGVLLCCPVQWVAAAGVGVGSSSLFSTLDYSDTFTGTDAGGRPDRPYIAAVQPAPAYVVENNYGNPPLSFQIGAGFSFAADGTGTPGFVDGDPAYPLSLGTQRKWSRQRHRIHTDGRGGRLRDPLLPA